MLKDSLKTIVLSLITLSLVGVAYAAWTEPTLTPPSGNTSTPINTSNTGQAKSGGLQLNTSGADVGLVVNGKQKVNTWLSYFDPATSNEYGVYQWESAGAGTTPVNYFQNNVGIGTTTPTAKLEIGGTAGVDGIKFPDGTVQTTSATSSVTSFVTGKYIGDGVNDREIAIGFQPDDVEVGIVNVLVYEILHRNKYMEINYSQGYSSSTWTANGIKNFTSNGFILGGAPNTMNEAGKTYWYKAFKGGTVPVSASPVINSISISPSPMATGQSTTISWSSTNAVSCSASGSQWSGAKSANGSQSIAPTSSPGSVVTYTLTCYNSDGSQSDTKSATVDVRDWLATTGSGNYGESCDSWLSRTGQAGVNGSAPLVAIPSVASPLNSQVGKCLYGTNDGIAAGDYGYAGFTSFSAGDYTGGFIQFGDGGQNINFYGPLSSNTSDSRIFPFHWHCCGNVSGTEAATRTRR